MGSPSFYSDRGSGGDMPFREAMAHTCLYFSASSGVHWTSAHTLLVAPHAHLTSQPQWYVQNELLYMRHSSPVQDVHLCSSFFFRVAAGLRRPYPPTDPALCV